MAQTDPNQALHQAVGLSTAIILVGRVLIIGVGVSGLA
jgi:hypothetical protein